MFHDVPLPASCPDAAWLLPDLLPAGQLVLLEGPSGVGKTLLAAALLAKIDHGDDPPFWIAPPEELDPLAHRHLLRHGVQPGRLRLMRVDLDWHGLQSDEPDEEALAGLELLFHTGRPRLVILDSFEESYPFLAKLPPERQRRFFRELRRYAAEYQCTFLINNTDARTALGRHAAETARVVLALDWHPHDRAQRLLTVAKNQLGPAGAQFHVTLEHGRAAWHTPTEDAYLPPAKTARPTPRKPGPASSLDEVATKLRNYLKKEDKPVAEVKGYLSALGYTASTVRKALELAHLTCERRGHAWWYLVIHEDGSPEAAGNHELEARSQEMEASSEPPEATARNYSSTQEPCLTA